MTGDLDQAEKWHTQEHNLHREMGYRFGIADSIGDLGVVAMHKGDNELAEERFQDARSRFEQLERVDGVAWIKGCLGELAVKTGDFEKARSFHREALDLQHTSQDPAWVLARLTKTTSYFEHTDNPERAVELCALAHTHDKVGVWTNIIVKMKLDELARKLPSELFDQARQRGEQLELWSTVDAVIDELRQLELSD
jgi:tetratricopeptide (TPR) repeat protein